MIRTVTICWVVALLGCRAKLREEPAPAGTAPAPDSESTPAPAQVAPPEPSSTVFTSGEAFSEDPELVDEIENYDIGPQHEPTPVGKVPYVESRRGRPEEIGCADGQREAFADVERYPTIAGCVGDFGFSTLRETALGQPCGDDLPATHEQSCTSAGVCARGWHICGNVRAESDESREDYRDLFDRISADDCDNAGPGRFNAALSHSDTEAIDYCAQVEPIGRREYRQLSCRHWGWGSEPVCCGSMCEFGACKDGVWPGRTRISRGLAQGCAEVKSETTPGVLCCKGLMRAWKY